MKTIELDDDELRFIRILLMNRRTENKKELTTKRNINLVLNIEMITKILEKLK